VGVGAYGVFGGFDRNRTERISGGGTKVVRVALVDALIGFDITPDTLIVDPGTNLVLRVVNEGDEPHDLAVDGGPQTSMLAPGESERLELGQIGEGIEPYCTLPGHRPAGMEMEIETRA
jgi:nitrite reductase (NO-forming)